MVCSVLSSFAWWRAVSTGTRISTVWDTQWFDLLHLIFCGSKVLSKDHRFVNRHKGEVNGWFTIDLIFWWCSDLYERILIAISTLLCASPSTQRYTLLSTVLRSAHDSCCIWEMSFAILLRVVDSDTKHQGNVRKAVVLFFWLFIKRD